MKNKKNIHGFTLIEVLISVTIIVILTIVGVVSYASVNKRSRDVKRKGDLEQIRSALEMYRSDNITKPGEYPANGGGTYVDAAGLVSVLVPTYLPAIPSDPNTDYKYYYKGVPLSGAYTSYCVCANLENPGITQSTCTPYTDHCTYGLKNP